MRAGFYTIDAPNPVPAVVTGLNASIQLGLVRLNGQQSADQVTEIISLTIRSFLSGAQNEQTLDYNLSSGSEDYNSESGSRDNGSSGLNYVNHRLRLVSTNDAATEFDSIVPDLITELPGARYFTCSIVGVWHIVELSAMEPGESFKVNTLEITCIDAGRLQ